MRVSSCGFVMGAVFLLNATSSFALNEVADPKGLRQKFNLSDYTDQQGLKDLKVAILDNGFMGFSAGKGYLPASAQVLNLTKIGQTATDHGLGMAQIVWTITGQNADGPQLYLINTNGFSNLKAAVQYVIQQKIDIVLYSQVWPFGGNFDGTGFINKLVTQAAESGTIWINAAGNHHGMVANGHVTAIDPTKNLTFENKLDQNPVTITLSWSDFQDDENYCTSKDLDLYVLDQSGKTIASSELTQKGQAPAPGLDPKLSCYAREAITLDSLDRGTYQIKIQPKPGVFTVSDRYRVLINAEKQEGINFTSHTDDGELMPPADNPLAITIGEKSEISSLGPTADGRDKPDWIVDDATVSFTSGDTYNGSSTAAALFAGTLALMKAQEPRLNAQNLPRVLRAIKQKGAFNDLRSAALTPVNGDILNLIPSGGKLMIQTTRNHFVILTPGDPFALPGPKAAKLSRLLPDDRLVYVPKTKAWFLIPNAQESQIKPPLVEFRTLDKNSKSWRVPSLADLRKMI